MLLLNQLQNDQHLCFTTYTYYPVVVNYEDTDGG